MSKIKSGWDKECYQYACSDGFHPSFWKTVTSSPQWQAWYKEQSRRLSELRRNPKAKVAVFDIDESQECGWLGELHFQEFLKFIKK
jgi:hypothetical protein